MANTNMVEVSNQKNMEKTFTLFPLKPLKNHRGSYDFTGSRSQLN